MIRFTCGLLVHLVCTTAGAIGARLSLRPLLFEGVKLKQTAGGSRRENADVHLKRISLRWRNPCRATTVMVWRGPASGRKMDFVLAHPASSAATPPRPCLTVTSIEPVP